MAREGSHHLGHLNVEKDGGSFFHVTHGQLFTYERPAELEGDVVGVADQECAVGGDEVVGTPRVGVGEASWDGKDLALIAGSDGGSDEGSAFLGGFDDDGGVCQGGDDAVAGGKVAGIDGCSRGVFGDKGSAILKDAFG